MFCTACGNRNKETARFCWNCGQAIQEADPNATVRGDAAMLEGNLETIAPEPVPAHGASSGAASSQARPRSTPAASPSVLTSSDPIGGGRFVPGTIVADRYRIVALLGRGGMGEVYRAEDLRLSQVLAIKFLPEAFSKNEGALARFHSEVRVARQVSHPNVCRDIRYRRCGRSAVPDDGVCRWGRSLFADAQNRAIAARQSDRSFTTDLRGIGGGTRTRCCPSRSETGERYARWSGKSAHHGFRLAGIAANDPGR